MCMECLPLWRKCNTFYKKEQYTHTRYRGTSCTQSKGSVSSEIVEACTIRPVITVNADDAFSDDGGGGLM